MLGWKDTLASEANTRRQKTYSAAMGRGGVYTPQIIVDGVTDVVGSREAQVEAAISARRSDMREVPILLSVSPGAVHIAIGSLPEKSADDATVWLFHVLRRAAVRIGAGENKGRNIDYRNVVRDIRAVAIWKGQPLSLDIPRGDHALPGYDSIAVLVQEGAYDRVVWDGAIEILSPFANSGSLNCGSIFLNWLGPIGRERIDSILTSASTKEILFEFEIQSTSAMETAWFEVRGVRVPDPQGNAE